MILKYSSNHHPLNMRLLLIALTCLAATLAAPQLKQKRDILPGDPRYGTDYHHNHHHHPETVVESTKSIGGYAYSIPETPLPLPQEVYGPPSYHPSIPVSSDYLPPTLGLKYTAPIQTYGVPAGVHFPLVTPTTPAPAVLDVKTIASTSLPLPLEKSQTVTLSPLATSYGTPVVDHAKTTVETIETPLKSVKTEIHGHSSLDLSKRLLKVKEHTPLLHGLTQFTGGVQSLPSVTSSVTKNYVSGSLVNKNLPTLQSTVGLVPTLSHAPSVYRNDHTTLTGVHADFSGYGAPLTSVHGLKTLNTDAGLPSLHGLTSVNVAAPVAQLHVTKTLPTLQHQTYGLPQTTYHLPESHARLEHVEPAVETFQTVTPAPLLQSVRTYQPAYQAASFDTLHAQPLQTVHTFPSVKTVDTLTHVEPVNTVNTVKTFESLTPVQHAPALHSYQSLPTSVHPLTSVKTFETLNPVHHAESVDTVHSVQPFTSVKTLKTVTPVLHAPTAHSYEPLPTVHPVTSVKTLETLSPVHHVESVDTVHSVQPFTSVKTLKTVTPVLHAPTAHSYEPLPTVHPVTSVKTLETLSPVHHVESVDTVHSVQPFTSVKTLKTVTPVLHAPTAHSYEPLPTVHPVTSVKTLETLSPVHHVDAVNSGSHAVDALETLDHLVDSVDVLPAVQRAHTYTNVVRTSPVIQKNVNVQVQKGPIGDFISSLEANLPSLPSFPQLPSLPSFSLPFAPSTSTTVSPIEPTVSPIATPNSVNTYVSEDHLKDSVTVENPLFRLDDAPSHVLAQHHLAHSNEYVQPTDENGGYVY
nr:mucin-5B-like isoform X1 [Megalopta genalis]